MWLVIVVGDFVFWIAELSASGPASSENRGNIGLKYHKSTETALS